jgi:multidrug efflux pump subunit AcrA (membrane-fusion protein)
MDKKLAVRLVIVIVAVFILYKITAGILFKPTIESGEKPFPVQVIKPAYKVISNSIALVGEVKGDTEVQVRPKTTGRVEELYADEGDEVEKGAPLLSFKAGISEDDNLYNDLVTFAPVSGVVGVKQIKEGEQIVSSMGTINPVFTIYQIDNVKINANVPERFVENLATGLTAQIRFDSYQNRIFNGRVRKVRPVMDPQSRTIQVEIYVNNPKHLIKPGMFAKVELILKHKINALVIPADALLEDVSKYVLVAKDGRAIKKDVQTGVRSSNEIEIITGLDPNDQVIIVGQRVANSGSKVEVKPND